MCVQYPHYLDGLISFLTLFIVSHCLCHAPKELKLLFQHCLFLFVCLTGFDLEVLKPCPLLHKQWQ